MLSAGYEKAEPLVVLRLRRARRRTGECGSSQRHRADPLGDRRTAIRHAWREWALEGRNRRRSGACVVGQAR